LKARCDLNCVESTITSKPANQPFFPWRANSKHAEYRVCSCFFDTYVLNLSDLLFNNTIVIVQYIDDCNYVE